MGLRPSRHLALLLFIAVLAPACKGKTKEGPPPPVPLAPGSFTVTPISTVQLRLDWTDVSYETYYQIERSLDGVTYTKLTTVSPDVVSYSDLGLQPSTPYYYRL